MAEPVKVRVPGEWPKGRPGKCELVFVAEAPADEECIYGKPLIGPSGRVHNQLLRVAGIDRATVATLNAIELELPTDEGQKYQELVEDRWCREQRLKGETWGGPEWEEWMQQWPEFSKNHWMKPEYLVEMQRLEREIEIAQPTVVVTLGFTATWALTRQLGAMKTRRGSLCWGCTTSGLWEGKVMPTFHPAAVLREWGMFSTVAGDYQRAARECATRELVFTPRELWLRPQLEDLDRWWDLWGAKAGCLSVDIETAAGQITCIGFSADETHALTVPFVDFETVNRSYWPTVEEEVAARMWVQKVLTSPGRKVFQNGPYDVYWLKRKWGVLPRGYTEDTRLLHHAMYPELPKSLAFMGSVYAKVNAWKRMREKDSAKRDE